MASRVRHWTSCRGTIYEKSRLKNEKVKDCKTGSSIDEEEKYYFYASLEGLSEARTDIRQQMARIVNEVDLIEKDPKARDG